MTELQTQVPRFEAPEPTRLQALSMRAAGMLLGAESKDPERTMQALVTQVGGYIEGSAAPDMGLGVRKATYVHDSARQIATSAAQDETTKQGHVMAYKNARDFTDSIGADLSSAVSSTVSKNRATGSKASTIRGRVARRLVNHAVKGVGVQAHKRK